MDKNGGNIPRQRGKQDTWAVQFGESSMTWLAKVAKIKAVEGSMVRGLIVQLDILESES